MSLNAPPNAAKILLVDNDKYFTTILGNALREHRFDVTVAQDGQEGLEQARSAEPNCLFLDLHTTKQAGERFCRDLKKDSRLMHTPIILLTAVAPGNLSDEIISYADAIVFKEQSEHALKKILSVIDSVTQNGRQRSKGSLESTTEIQSSLPSDTRVVDEAAGNLLNHLPCGIMLTQANGQISLVNLYVQDVLERNTQQLISKNVEQVLPGLNFSALSEAAKTSQNKPARVFYGKRLLEVACHLLGDQAATSGSFLFFVNDQTQKWWQEQEHKRRKQSLEEEVLQQTQELEKTNRQLKEVNTELNHMNHLKSEFLANMSHELRSPLNDILGFTQLLTGRTYGEITPRQEEAVSLISESAYVLLNLINGILDHSKLEAGEIIVTAEKVNLAEMLQEIEKGSKHLLRGRPVKFRLDTVVDLPVITSDREKLRQVITNLVHNAIKFTKRGSIKVSARNLANLNKVEICVEDTGIGIAKTDLKIIFEAFRQVDGSSTREFEGTGLGLAITSKLLALLNGEVAVASTLGVGSTFRVLLPHDLQTKWPNA